MAPAEAAPPPRLLCRGLGEPGGAISAHATASRANGSALADDDLDYDLTDGAQYGAQYADDEGAAAAAAGPRYDADHHLTATRLRLLSLPLAANARVGGADVDGADADVVRAFLRQHTSRQPNLRRWALLPKDAFGQVRNGDDGDDDDDGDGNTSRHKSSPDAAAGVEGLGGVFSANCRCQLDLQSLNLTNVGGERAVARPCLLPQSRLRSHVVHLLRYAASPAAAHATTRIGNGLGNGPGNEGVNSGAATNSSGDGTTTPRTADALRGGARESLRGGGKVDMLVDIDWDTTDVELAMESYLLSDVSDTGMSHPGASRAPPSTRPHIVVVADTVPASVFDPLFDADEMLDQYLGGILAEDERHVKNAARADGAADTNDYDAYDAQEHVRESWRENGETQVGIHEYQLVHEE